MHDYLDREPAAQAGRVPVGGPGRDHAKPSPSIDELQRQGREAWLALQADRHAKERAGELQPESNGQRLERNDRPLSLDEQRAQGRGAWKRLREQGPPAPASEHQKTPEQERDRGHEIEGPDLEL